MSLLNEYPLWMKLITTSLLSLQLKNWKQLYTFFDVIMQDEWYVWDTCVLAM